MSGEEHTLPVELERLEIESGKTNNPVAVGDENPFQRRSNGRSNNSALFGIKCNHCNNISSKKSSKNKVAFKRTNGRLLKDPVLKYVNSCQMGADRSGLASSFSSVSLSPTNRSNSSCTPREDVHTLVSGCSQMRISTEDESKEDESRRDSSEDRVNNNSNSGLVACSQQALNPPCDVTMDELACYFETLVHIPKKMSSMAEMMYI